MIFKWLSLQWSHFFSVCSVVMVQSHTNSRHLIHCPIQIIQTFFTMTAKYSLSHFLLWLFTVYLISCSQNVQYQSRPTLISIPILHSTKNKLDALQYKLIYCLTTIFIFMMLLNLLVWNTGRPLYVFVAGYWPKVIWWKDASDGPGRRKNTTQVNQCFI